MSDDAHFPLPDVSWPPARPFWAGAARRELHLPRCATCATLNAVGDTTCRRCDGSTFEWERLSGHAVLYAWAYVRRAFLPQFADQVPFLTALVGIAEDTEVRLATRLVQCDPADLRIDLPLEVVFEPLPFAGDGAPVLAPYFRPRSA
jgi:uncharacterized OB-fold protein